MVHALEVPDPGGGGNSGSLNGMGGNHTGNRRHHGQSLASKNQQLDVCVAVGCIPGTGEVRDAEIDLYGLHGFARLLGLHKSKKF